MTLVTDSRWGRAHPDVVAIACLFLTTALIFAPPLLAGRTVTPMTVLAEHFPWRAVVPPDPPPTTALTDIAQVFHPWLIWVGEQVRHGIVPLWNPHAYTAVAFLSPNHTADWVELTSLGPGSERLAPSLSIDQIHAALIGALDLPPARPI
jgi:hypothetical protein